MNLKDISNYFLINLNIEFSTLDVIKEHGLSYVYKVRYNENNYILKIYRKKLDFKSSDNLIRFLNANKINSIKALSTHEIGDYICAFYPYIEGKHIFNYSDIEIDQLTNLLSVLYKNNLTNSDYTIIDKCDSYFSYLLSRNDKYVSNDIYKLLYMTYKNLVFSNDDFVLVHGDLSNTNLIWNESINVIDFDETIMAPREYELCSCIIKNCFDNGVFDICQAKKIFDSLNNKVEIDYKKFRTSWNLYIIKVIVEKLFYLEQSAIKKNSEKKGRDHWSYWYNLLLNESIISELFNYNKNNIIYGNENTQVLKLDNKSYVSVISDPSKKKYVKKVEFAFDERQSKDEYNLVNMLNNFGLNDLSLYNMAIKDNEIIKYFSFCEGSAKAQLSDDDLKKTTQKLYSIYDFLLKYGTDSLQNETGDIIKKLYWCLDVLKDTKYSSVILDLINDKDFANCLYKEKSVIVLDDLHRDNIMFNRDGSITFIDFNGLKKYPKSLQLASLITNLLLLYGDERIECIIDNWKDPIDYIQLNKLIKYRVLKGIAYYERYLAKYNNKLFDSKAKTLQKYLDNMI